MKNVEIHSDDDVDACVYDRNVFYPLNVIESYFPPSCDGEDGVDHEDFGFFFFGSEARVCPSPFEYGLHVCDAYHHYPSSADHLKVSWGRQILSSNFAT
mmetsp:Transcript_42137/g.48484  ORF Transcript_42137/g.48484 Transcript_42137/m.48484 type:complete len:99 (+) Transcript_42137:201-497(+)